jgi:hypothetical protein
MGILTTNIPEGYITGLGRDYPHPKIAHLYKGDFAEPGNPMCASGWNRDGGESYSIWRGNQGVDGICKVCLRRAREGRAPVEAKQSVKTEKAQASPTGNCAKCNAPLPHTDAACPRGCFSKR